MPKRKVAPVCPHCKHENSVNDVLGVSGLLNSSGMTTTCICRRCKRSYVCKAEVKILYSTSKEEC